MNNIEKQLAEEKMRMESITAPEELETRLRTALNAVPPKRTKRISPVWKIAAVVVLVIAICGNNYNAFAYYGKQLFGFDELMEDNLKQLNDKGMGQIIEKKTTLIDGTEFVIDGIMTDATQLIMYYTLSNPHGFDQNDDPIRLYRISGFWTNSFAASGTSIMNEKHTEIKGTMTFDSVSPFAKKLTLHYSQPVSSNGQMSDDMISFPYNPNQALQTQLRQSINKTLKVDKGSLTFQSITATPTQTVIKGTMQVDNYDRVSNVLDGIELRANGIVIPIKGYGSGSSLGGKKFDLRYDALPEKVQTLELVMKQFVGYQSLDKKLSLETISAEPFKMDGKDLWIKDVSITAENVEITIATEDDVMLDGVSIETQGENTPLQTTVRQDLIKQADGTILKERTLLFDTKNKPEYLLIKGMHYMKTYNKVIKIPVK
ncbi:DUF4179 domain-containing protein [Paenibacillus sp. D2_2]|uniref:DUF4179 domain-containing protein n=1 Tax=Paenibacillus sp. D2_2 TaxID=3073092 RepID=UPI002814DE70|nr:DUF4179 domain-containing protein [Paenibacillus sp. D2_2]WMT40407.1 DUF4179 domain-containing protein [Paenibacillus sp. D2_2]